MKKSELQIIYEKHFNEIYLYTLSKIHRRDIAKDIVTEAFLKVWRANAEVKNVRSYLFTTAKNLCFDYISSKAKEEEVSRLCMEKQESADVSYEEIASKAERIKKALNSLPSQCKEIIIDRYFSNLSLSEIAEDRNISLSTVKNHLQNGKSRLRKVLDFSDLTIYFLFF